MAWVPGPESVGDVWILDLQDLARRRLTTGLGVATRLAGRCLAWSPDGRHIAAVTVRPEAYDVGAREIAIISADNGRAGYSANRLSWAAGQRSDEKPGRGHPMTGVQGTKKEWP